MRRIKAVVYGVGAMNSVATRLMLEKGVDIVWGPRITPTYARAEIRDPNGYHIELRQWFR